MSRENYYRRPYKKRKSNKGKLFIFIILILIVCISYIFISQNIAERKEIERQEALAKAERLASAERARLPMVTTLQRDPLKSKSAILLALPSGDFEYDEKANWVNSTDSLFRINGNIGIIYENNSNEKILPASMTKIMTAIVAIENIQDKSKKITITPEMLKPLLTEGASIAGFKEGEEVSVEDLLYGLMLPSGSECAMALALEAAGSVDAFVQLMNDKAQEIGMDSSHFSNTIGLDDNNENYSTVSDIANLLIYSLGNEEFRKVFTTNEHVSAPTSRNPAGLELSSSLNYKKDLVLKRPEGEIFGGKTGFTKAAGQCLASMMEKNGVYFILVTAGAPGENGKDYFHIDDMLTMFESTFVIKIPL